LSPNPTATELAEIAKLSAENASFHGIKKRKIAFLNAGHDNKKMTEARDIFIQENSADSIEVCEVISAQEAI
jgi:phosphotransacetylase